MVLEEVFGGNEEGDGCGDLNTKVTDCGFGIGIGASDVEKPRTGDFMARFGVGESGGCLVSELNEIGGIGGDCCWRGANDLEISNAKAGGFVGGAKEGTGFLFT